MDDANADARPPVLLSFDVEDWHQLLRRRLGVEESGERNPAFERQMAAILALLDELGTSATFFLLGITAERHPDVVREIAARGHELACHGYAHAPVNSQSRDEFRADVERCATLIESITGRRPTGFRAPAFSIDSTTPWAYEVLAELGFDWDSSMHDSPRLPHRIRPVPETPCRLQLASGAELLELPVAVWRTHGRTLPMGGGSAWRLTPARVLARALHEVANETAYPVLYFHPYEFDPRLLRPSLPRSAAPRQRLRALYRPLRTNPGRARVAPRLRRIAREFRFVSHEQASTDIERDFGSRTRALSGSSTHV